MNLLALNLRFLVKKTGKPATLVSKEMDACNSTLHLYMHGVSQVRIEFLRVLCEYFDIPSDQLLFHPLNDEVRDEYNKLQDMK